MTDREWMEAERRTWIDVRLVCDGRVRIVRDVGIDAKGRVILYASGPRDAGLVPYLAKRFDAPKGKVATLTN